MAYSGGIAAAAAAKKKREQMRLQAEEEDMTKYTQEDLKNDWEFKIVRSDAGAFRKPEVLKELIDEEARAGWTMVEKFDDHRIRFKRPSKARARDNLLPKDIDPYRTQYGAPSARYARLVSVLLGLLALGGGLAFFLMTARTSTPTETTTTPVVMWTALALIVLGLVAVGWKLKRS
jgi:hypothetical protein